MTQGMPMRSQPRPPELGDTPFNAMAPAGSTAGSNASWFTPEEAELLRRELVANAVRQRVFAGSGWLDALAADLVEVRRRTALSDGAAA